MPSDFQDTRLQHKDTNVILLLPFTFSLFVPPHRLPLILVSHPHLPPPHSHFLPHPTSYSHSAKCPTYVCFYVPQMTETVTRERQPATCKTTPIASHTTYLLHAVVSCPPMLLVYSQRGEGGGSGECPTCPSSGTTVARPEGVQDIGREERSGGLGGRNETEWLRSLEASCTHWK